MMRGCEHLSKIEKPTYIMYIKKKELVMMRKKNPHNRSNVLIQYTIEKYRNKYSITHDASPIQPKEE